MTQTTTIDLQAMLAGYLECALWASTGDDDRPLDDTHCETDISEESQAQAREDCADFVRGCVTAGIDLDELYPRNASGIGHDLWLTRNHHGAGFWDRGFGELGDRLSKLAHLMGSRDAYVGDDGLVYFQ